MALYHLSVKVISRSRGRSVVAAAAYRSATKLHDERLGRSHGYRTKSGVIHAEILLPKDAPERWRDRATLWNEVEARDRRRDAQLAREIKLALPREISAAEGIELVRSFVREECVRRGMVADLCVHQGTASDGEPQPHAHVLLTLRQVAPAGALDRQGRDAGFGAKERGWNAQPLLTGWRVRWAEVVNQRLFELGHEARVDHRSFRDRGIPFEPQNKVGPAGSRRALRGEAAVRRDAHDRIAQRNGARILADPGIALAALTEQQSTVTRHDMARFISRHTHGAEQFAAVMAKVEASPDLVVVGVDGRGRTRFSTRDMVAAERRMEWAAAELAKARGHAVPVPVVTSAIEASRLRGEALGEEQEAAVRHLMNAAGLSLVIGIAGGGKSTTLGVASEAWKAAGYRVRGAALSGIAAEGLERGSSIPSRTLASLERAWSRGIDPLTSRDVLVVDEAGMVGSRQMERLLARARKAGAKVVLAGDAEQLPPIDAGGAFRALIERHGAAEIRKVRRQHKPWQQEATRDLAAGQVGAALDRYAGAGMIHAEDDKAAARAAVVELWESGRR